jgi:hypothetical protein
LTTLLVQGLAAKSHTASSTDDCSSSDGLTVSVGVAKFGIVDGIDVEVRSGDVTPNTTPPPIDGAVVDVLLVACRVTPPPIGGARLDALLTIR